MTRRDALKALRDYNRGQETARAAYYADQEVAEGRCAAGCGRARGGARTCQRCWAEKKGGK